MKVERIHFEKIDSTNSWAKREVSQLGAEALWLITAAEQTAGRGRFDRSWVSPEGKNVYVTFCFFRESLWPGIGNVPQVLALSAVSVLEELGFRPRIKWPNDLLLSEKKVAGILAETTSCDLGVAVIVGIGININMPLADCSSIDRPATSLLVESGEAHSVEEVINLLQQQFEKDLDLLLDQGFSSFLSRFRTLATPPSPMISFSDGQQIWKGKQVGIDDEGALLLEIDTGEVKIFHAGEILFTS